MTKALVSATLKSIDKEEYELENNNSWQQDHARLVEQFFNEPNVDLVTIAEVLYGLQDLQVRDYAMGIMRQGDLIQRLALRTLIKYSSGKYQKPPKTLMALWYWENGDTVEAQKVLLKVANYSLAQLLVRCMMAGWSADAFQTMRTELHPKVCVNIFGESVVA